MIARVIFDINCYEKDEDDVPYDSIDDVLPSLV